MLTLGMVPALYNDEEKEQVIGQVRTGDRTGNIDLFSFLSKSVSRMLAPAVNTDSDV